MPVTSTEATTEVMPIGNRIGDRILPQQVKTTEGNAAPPEYDEDAAATIVWENFQIARNYVEQNAWLLEWQETDLLYQSPTPNRFVKIEQGRPPRVSRFLVAKNARTMARAVKRALFAQQYPFLLRPSGKTTQPQTDAWSALIGKLLKRMKFAYYCGLLIDSQVLQGTGLGKIGVEEKTVVRKSRRRKRPPEMVEQADGSKQEINTVETDEFEIIRKEVKESWPFFEYRRLGTTLFDPKWCTPDRPDESAGYVIDVDFVYYSDLQEMRKLSCYKNIPNDKVLKQWLFNRQEGSAQSGTQVEENMTAQGSQVAHAESRNRQTDKDPLKQPIMLIEQWDTRTVKTILEYEGRKLLIRDETHDYEASMHLSATWWPIENCGYGIGIGRLNGADQRINQGIINESLKMIAYPFNAPLVIARGQNAPTQNVITRMGGLWQVDLPPGGDLRKTMGFLEMPPVPPDAWKMLELSQRGGEEMSGANSPFQQGNLPGPGSSAARTATGANRIAGMSDQSVADPVESVVTGVVIPTIEFLIRYVREKMPLSEIRDILSSEHAAVIENALAEESFLDATFEVDVLAGQKLMARGAIQQLIPFFLQLAQQPQLLEYLHQRGETIDFKEIMDLLLEVSELMQQPGIFRKLTPEEMQTVKSMNPGAQRVQQALTVEQMKGQNKLQAIAAEGEVDRANQAAKVVMDHAASGIPLSRASGLVQRSTDEQILRNGLPMLGE